MIRRTFDATALNEVANHPDVRPWLGGDGPLDLTPLVSNPANVTLEAEGGGWVLENLLPGVYELHTLFTPEARGKPYFKAAKEALRWMFTATDALELLTKCPDDNPGARMAASMVGFAERAYRPNAWNDGHCGVSFQALSIDGWLARDSVIASVGAELWGATGGQPLDEAHARLTGAAVLMIRGGQASKAVGIFNRAAVFLGFRGIVALRDDVIDIGHALVHVKPEGFGVLLTAP